jgi:hypothetical protein
MRGIRFSLAALCLSGVCGPAPPATAQDAGDALDLAALSPQASVLAPGPLHEARGARIGWEVEDIGAAFRRASADGLPVVVVTDPSSGGLFVNTLRCPTFNTFAGQAHFILIPLPIADENSEAARLANAMHMDTAFKSTIAVLAMRDRQVHEVLRISGNLSEGDLIDRFGTIGLAPARPNPLPLERIALGTRMPRDCESSSGR